MPLGKRYTGSRAGDKGPTAADAVPRASSALEHVRQSVRPSGIILSPANLVSTALHLGLSQCVLGTPPPAPASCIVLGAGGLRDRSDISNIHSVATNT